MDDWEEDDWEEQEAYLVGCTCVHESDEHGWGGCEVEGCDCEGAWEE